MVSLQDSDVFLSACMSGDEDEVSGNMRECLGCPSLFTGSDRLDFQVEELLAKGAHINTATVDGLTALHQVRHSERGERVTVSLSSQS